MRVDGAVKNKTELSLSQLQNDYPQHEVACALQCAGNRRHTMRTLLKEVDGLDWGDGAVMNCRWRGPRLRDVLTKAGLDVEDWSQAHVAFACSATQCQDDSWYGGSIPLERGMWDEGEVILALEVLHPPRMLGKYIADSTMPQMNGKTLPINNGYPVRIIAPGIAGARSVKWLDRITVQLGESQNFYQQLDYKILPPEATTKELAKQYWHTVPAVQDMPINSVIAVPATGQTVTLNSRGMTTVRGYALPQGTTGPVTRVEVSVDGGTSWSDAEIVDGNEGRGKWCWVIWSTTITLQKGASGRILSRATDVGGNVQCACPAWNFRGVAYNGYGEARDLEIV